MNKKETLQEYLKDYIRLLELEITRLDKE